MTVQSLQFLVMYIHLSEEISRAGFKVALSGNELTKFFLDTIVGVKNTLCLVMMISYQRTSSLGETS